MNVPALQVTGTEPAPAPARLVRFGFAARSAHWVTATLLLALIATAAVLYLPSVAAAVGRRETVRRVHVAAGLLLPVPLLAGLLFRGGEPTLASEVRRLGRWDRRDRRWLASFGRDPAAAPGKFNAGQKLFAAFIAGSMASMLLSGSVMHWFSPFPLAWRTGATFSHDWLALAIVVAVAGHVVKALSEPVALLGMIRGSVPTVWAQTHRPRWHDEVRAEEAGPGAPVVPSAGPAPRERRGRLAATTALAVLVAGALSVAFRAGPDTPSLLADAGPGAPAVAVQWEETVDRAAYDHLWDLASPALRRDRSRAEFVRDEVARLLPYADEKGDVVGVAVDHSAVKGAEARVTLTLKVADLHPLHPGADTGAAPEADLLELPQEIGLRRHGGRWLVVDYPLRRLGGS